MKPQSSMPSSNPKAFYQENTNALEAAIRKVKKSIFYCYLLRLFTFIAFVTLLIGSFQSLHSSLFIALSALSFILFLAVVQFDLRLARKEKFLHNKLVINRQELEYLEHRYGEQETGEEFRYMNPHLAADFDIVGTGSLYQYLNRCSTGMGKHDFARGLCHPCKNPTSIRRRQQGIMELSGKQNFLHDFRAQGMFLEETGNEKDSLMFWINESAPKILIMKVLRILIPLINASWLVLIFTGILPLQSFLLPVLVSLFIAGNYNRRIKKAHEQLGRTAATFEKYTRLIRLMENQGFDSGDLSAIRARLFSGTGNASRALTRLFRLLKSFDMRYNMLVSFILNALVLVDIQVYCRLWDWKSRHKADVSAWFEALTRMDAITGFAVFAFNNRREVCVPEVVPEAFNIEAKETGHPLLHPENRVNNSFSLNHTPSITIITGANMAGKSTFLRTMAVNLILAMNGAPVPAGHFRFSPCDIMSNMKIEDSIYYHESYFYAELKRIREIINKVTKGERTLVVLDEILRGTNTRDKHQGSVGIIKKLMLPNMAVLVATHDLSLGELEQEYPGTVTNQCFEVELEKGRLVFDYKLKPGVSQKLNASFLMREMGIID